MSELIQFVRDHPWWTLVYIYVIVQGGIYAIAAFRGHKPD